ncbi:hypothetical protein R3P38DRAFT_3192849 [Favolaschia claudopus]|uniref:Uncharacterized protein n=1 Tax=Favolaschia claudopus TaxID=2862362 RepID=A0AAW0BLH1_9AGAR
MGPAPDGRLYRPRLLLLSNSRNLSSEVPACSADPRGRPIIAIRRLIIARVPAVLPRNLWNASVGGCESQGPDAYLELLPPAVLLYPQFTARFLRWTCTLQHLVCFPAMPRITRYVSCVDWAKTPALLQTAFCGAPIYNSARVAYPAFQIGADSSDCKISKESFQSAFHYWTLGIPGDESHGRDVIVGAKPSSVLLMGLRHHLHEALYRSTTGTSSPPPLPGLRSIGAFSVGPTIASRRLIVSRVPVVSPLTLWNGLVGGCESEGPVSSR